MFGETDLCAPYAMLTDATVTAGIEQERGFLDRYLSDEDIVSSVGCTIETTIDACVVLCGGSTWEHCENGRHRRSPMMEDMIILRADWNNFTVAIDVPSSRQ